MNGGDKLISTSHLVLEFDAGQVRALDGVDLSRSSLVGVTSSGIEGHPILPPHVVLVGGVLVGPGANLAGVTLAPVSLANVDLFEAIFTHERMAQAFAAPLVKQQTHACVERFAASKNWNRRQWSAAQLRAALDASPELASLGSSPLTLFMVLAILPPPPPITSVAGADADAKVDSRVVCCWLSWAWLH